MKLKVISAVMGVALAIGCSRTEPNLPPADLIKEENPVAGVIWSYPAAWTRQHEQPMRVATYVIPAAESDSVPGECGVFFFGSDQGGDVDANIQRWGSQFEGATQAEKTAMEVEGMNVAVVRIEGTFLAPGGPMMQSRGKMEGYTLLGAIIEAPGGMVFFKSTGPQQTIAAAEPAFLAMVRSLQKHE